MAAYERRISGSEYAENQHQSSTEEENVYFQG
jgi:hypothetical protein